MSEAHQRPNEPTEADLTRTACGLARETLAMAGQLMEALEAGKQYFPPAAVPIVDKLGADFRRIKGQTEAALIQVAA